MSAIDTATAILSTATAVESPTETPTPAPPTATSTETPPADDSSTAVATDSPEAEGAKGDSSGTPSPLPTTPQIRAALKAFRDSNPDHAQAAKLLNDGYSRFEAYKSVFPTVDEARSIKTQLDTLGGLEGIAEMQHVMTSIEETDALLEAGDPKVLDQILEDSPEGFKRLAPHYLDRLQKADPQAYGAALQPHFVRALSDAGLPNVLNFLASKLSDNPEVLSVVRSMQTWFDEQKSLADRSKSDVLAPDRERLNTERQQFEKERRETFERGIAQTMTTHIQSELGSRLRPYVAAINALPPAIQQDVARASMSTLARALEADKAYQTQINAMMNARKPDQAKIISLNKAKVSALADSIIAAVVKNYSLKPGSITTKTAATKTETKSPAVPKTLIKLSSPPKESEVDWNHPHMTQAVFIQHRAMLRDGRFVTW